MIIYKALMWRIRVVANMAESEVTVIGKCK